MDRMEARTLIDETIRREVGRVIEQEVGRALRVMGMPVAEGREERPLLGAGTRGRTRRHRRSRDRRRGARCARYRVAT